MEVLPDVGINPSWGLSEGGEFRLQTVSFGDGYEQRRPDGINTTIRKWSVDWELLSREQKDTLYDFLLDLRGVDPFLWRVPDSGEVVQVVCKKKPSWAVDDYDSYSLTAEFTEDFNP